MREADKVKPIMYVSTFFTICILSYFSKEVAYKLIELSPNVASWLIAIMNFTTGCFLLWVRSYIDKEKIKEFREGVMLGIKNAKKTLRKPQSERERADK